MVVLLNTTAPPVTQAKVHLADAEQRRARQNLSIAGQIDLSHKKPEHWVVVAVSQDPNLRGIVARSFVNGTAPFVRSGLVPGEYFVAAWIDVDSDGMWTEGEPRGTTVTGEILRTVVLDSDIAGLSFQFGEPNDGVGPGRRKSM